MELFTSTTQFPTLLPSTTVESFNYNQTLLSPITSIPAKILSIYLPIPIIIFGIFGNLATFFTILFSPLRKTYVNKYLMIILISDTELLIKLAVERTFKTSQINYFACFISQYLWNLPLYITNLTVLLLTIERFFAIIFPLNHLKYSHIGRWRIIIAMLAFSAAINLNLFFVLANNESGRWPNESNKCVYKYYLEELPHAKLFFLIPRLLFTFLIPLSSIIFVNIFIAIRLRGRSLIQSSANVPNETRTNNKILFIIPAAYVLLNLPQNIYLAVTQFIDRRFNNRQLNYFTLGFFFLNHSINFLLYAHARCLQYINNIQFANQIFRQTFIRLWIHPFCRHPSNSTSTQKNSDNSKETNESKF